MSSARPHLPSLMVDDHVLPLVPKNPQIEQAGHSQRFWLEDSSSCDTMIMFGGSRTLDEKDILHAIS